ncbi:hypothetical protein C4K16_3440 [Pseudomonas chlororaphis subsp. aurantiaca]|nr:hypothetical protein C4K16_3440 [Pseudomonas chlororaphis subsp. aurantiaca]
MGYLRFLWRPCCQLAATLTPVGCTSVGRLYCSFLQASPAHGTRCSRWRSLRSVWAAFRRSGRKTG